MPGPTQNETREAAHSDAAKQSALEAVSKSEGGKIIIAAAVVDIENSVNEIIAGYIEMPEASLRALCAKLAVNHALFKTLTGAEEKKAYALKELKELGEDLSKYQD